jgi:ribosomal-protein-alanine N-acetyltransferase
MYHNKKIILQPLTEKDATFFYHLYTLPQLSVNFDESPFLPHETPVDFTNRIISVCQFIFTIRTREQPDLVIGDCALHHWNKDTSEIIIGGSLLPEYWGQGLMQSAFELLSELAKKQLGVKTLLGPTKVRNHKAIRLVEKMGFTRHDLGDGNTVMKKEL